MRGRATGTSTRSSPASRPAGPGATHAHDGRRSPPTASPTLPGLTNRHPPARRTSGRWVWPVTTQSAPTSAAISSSRSRIGVGVHQHLRRGIRRAVHHQHLERPHVHAAPTAAAPPGRRGSHPTGGAPSTTASPHARRPDAPAAAAVACATFASVLPRTHGHPRSASRDTHASGSDPRSTRSPVHAPREIPAARMAASVASSAATLPWMSPSSASRPVGGPAVTPRARRGWGNPPRELASRPDGAAGGGPPPGTRTSTAARITPRPTAIVSAPVGLPPPSSRGERREHEAGDEPGEQRRQALARRGRAAGAPEGEPAGGGAAWRKGSPWQAARQMKFSWRRR